MSRLTGRRLIMLCVSSSLSLSVCWAVMWLSGPDTAWPHMVFDRTEHNWGLVKPGTIQHASFRFTNRGAERLRIEEMRTTCGCTKPKLSRREIPPGETGTISLELQIPDDLNSIHHQLYITTNEPQDEKHTLYVYAQPWIGVTATPQALDMGQVRTGTTVQKTLDVVSNDGKLFAITSAYSNVRTLSVKLQDAARISALHRIHVTFTAGEPLGQLTGRLQITTSRDDGQTLGIPVSAQIVGEFRLSPNTLTIDAGEIGKVVQRTFLLALDEDDAQPPSVDCQVDSPWRLLSVDVQPAGKKLYRISCKVRYEAQEPLNPRAAMRVQIRIGPREHLIMVPLSVRGMFAPSPEAQ